MSAPLDGHVVGVVGLGNMGTPMSANLVAAGATVRAFDIAAEARERFAAAVPGAEIVGSTEETAAGAEAVLLSLPNSDVVESVIGGGLADALEPGAVLVDMSSSEPPRTVALAERLAADGKVLIDAPVSGGVSGARAATLAVMAGGPEETVAKVRPLLAALGRPRHVGAVGAGHALKALNNLMSAAHLVASSEAMLIGRRFGLHPEVMLDVVRVLRRTPVALTDEQQAIKDEFVRVRGKWGEEWQHILELDPAFLRAYLNFSAVPWRREPGALEPKVRELIYITVDASATHMYTRGLRKHIAAALGHGARPAEIMEVLELTSTLGIHTCNIGVPLLIEVLDEEGLRDGPAELTEHQEKLKARFTETRGYWHSFWDGLLELDPELFEAYLEFSAVPWRTGTLEPKIKELVYCAFDAAATHLYVPGLKQHLRNAVRLGATVPEIMEVFEIASVIGVHAATTAAPILAELSGREGRP
ncbi:MAG: NAD-binding protein [Streptosporangiales bacterium]|nr:NAD-binding protein [Streptosporangiales bacterium]